MKTHSLSTRLMPSQNSLSTEHSRDYLAESTKLLEVDKTAVVILYSY